MILKSQNQIPKKKKKTSQPDKYLADHNNTYCASVPIFVYRQLVEELEATKLDLENEKNLNKNLIAHNKQLQEEVAKIVVSAQNLENLVQIKPKIGESKSKITPDKILIKTDQGSSEILLANDSSLPEVFKQIPQTEEHIMEVEYTESNPQANSGKNLELKGFWLFFVILIVILSCFMGSFFLVQFLQKNNNN
jgi:hypothetical protein